MKVVRVVRVKIENDRTSKKDLVTLAQICLLLCLPRGPVGSAIPCIRPCLSDGSI